MNYKVWIVVLSSNLTSVFGCGQVIRGKIMSTLDVPVEYALVVNVRTSGHTHSNAVGYFELPAEEGDTLSISHLAHRDYFLLISSSLFNQPITVYLQEQPLELKEVVVESSRQMNSDLIRVDLAINPVLSAQDILRRVPGLITGQHAGGGKAEQLFLRGFDLDHGTDIKLGVEGMPVNMVSHAHGQGYADLHFVIPELVDRIEYGKGPYAASQGNMANAAFVDFKLRKQIEHNQVGVEVGSFNTWRGLTLLKLPEIENKSYGYVAGEYLYADGPFEHPQFFNRHNIMARYSWRTNHGSLTASFSQFGSRWNASGQIPQRAVDDGLITRFGSIDPDEGGYTHRQNIWLEHQHIFYPHSWIQTRLFYSHYDFELYSNFTFFYRDSLNGDQIRQKENRQLWGAESKWTFEGQRVQWQHGAGWRGDHVNDNELSYTRQRKETLQPVALGHVTEYNFYLYGQAEFNYKSWTFTPGWRLDQLIFNYQDQLNNHRRTQDHRLRFSPKFNLNYRIREGWNAYAHSGVGFHTNDARVLLNNEAVEILPHSLGADVGLHGKLSPRLYIHPSWWYLYLQDEWVYVGDEGIVESAGRTRRLGADLSLRYQWSDAWYFDQDFTYSHGRSLDAPANTNRIPLAPVFTLTNGVSWQSHRGLNGSLRSRFLSDRPANEDNSIVAKGYFLIDATISIERPHIKLSFGVENIFNSRWNETQFATTSRLHDEIFPTEEIHFIPGTPRNLKFKANWLF